MASRLCCGGALTRDCPSGLEIGALVATLLLYASDHHKKTLLWVERQPH